MIFSDDEEELVNGINRPCFEGAACNIEQAFYPKGFFQAPI